MAKEKDAAETPDGTALLAAVLNRLVDAQEANRGLSKEDLAEVMEANSEGVRRALRPENQTHPDVSDFNPLGERDNKRPQLKRKTFWIGVPLERDELTLAEIELFNQIDHPMEARNGTWRADIRNGGTELHINFPNATMDERMDLPSMRSLLTELVGGTRAVDPDTLLARVAELEKKLNAQTAA
jgi:hypothetical protein